MGLTGRNIIVAGAGIGGLAAALALRARGAEVTVLEQACEIAEVGAGLQISPNGAAVLRAMGLGEALSRAAVPSRAVVLRDYRRGGEVLRLDLARYAAGQDFYLVHRADLIGLLAGAARTAGIPLRLLQRVEAVVPGPVPELHLANGAQARADLVVGADGLQSRARVALNGDDRPFFTGQVAWRATVPNDLRLPAEAQIFMGPGRHMVCYPLRGGRLVNIVAVQERRDWADEGWHHDDDPGNLRAAFSDFRGLPAELLAQVREVALWGLFRHPVAARWQGEGVAILGDAAHPTLPFLAQGANLALEDAWVLADCLAGEADQAAALAAYQARRRERAARVIAAANANAWKYHFGLSPIRELGHMALRLGGTLAPTRAVRQFDWIYGYDVTAQSR
ncbi:FAD-dependent monooxygenase [Antarcticimicrobium luteum]|uniref:Monooxygenase n=1 Tax=Antarcticimicrobium luteum TaxID=2547397 RepID=A0A4R5VEG8_9RHOB|nr:FAD-dependent monooxygenase [Antarcticimicrobium luteum]TDK50802.1 monooxygenase [Antarcticimicrobium luteum]